MKKTIVLIMLTLLALSIVPLAYAQEEPVDRSIKSAATGLSCVALITEGTTKIYTGGTTEYTVTLNDADTETRSATFTVNEETFTIAENKQKELTGGAVFYNYRMGLSRDDPQVLGMKFSIDCQPSEVLSEVHQQLVDAKQRYLEAKAQYLETRKQYLEGKSDLLKLKEKARCNDDSTDCQEKKSELKRGVKQHLLKTNELIARSLEKLTNRVEESKALTEEERTNALAAIAELEERLTAEQERVNSLAANATNEELRTAIPALKSVWQEVRKEQHTVVSLLISSKLEEVVEKQEKYAEHMQSKIDELAARDIVVTELQALQDQFETQVAELEQDLAEFRAGTTTWTGVREDLHTAKQTLREFLAKYKELKSDTEEDEE